MHDLNVLERRATGREGRIGEQLGNFCLVSLRAVPHLGCLGFPGSSHEMTNSLPSRGGTYRSLGWGRGNPRNLTPTPKIKPFVFYHITIIFPTFTVGCMSLACCQPLSHGGLLGIRTDGRRR